MLNFLGPAWRDCSRISRRSFLTVGGLALGGLTLADLLSARAAQKSPQREKSAILIFLSGGPSHLDTWDMKPHLSEDVRGEFKPIKSRVPGMELCELLPLSAQVADRFAVLRGVATVGFHTGNEFYSGYAYEEGNAGKPKGQKRPAFGSIVSRFRSEKSAVPPYVSLQDVEQFEQADYAGAAHQPFRFHFRSQHKEALQNLALCKHVSPARLQDRKELLAQFEGMRRDLDASGAMAGSDAFNARALEIVTSGRVRDAFDLRKEPDRIRQLYGDRRCASGFVPGQLFLQARRLVEAGVSVVTVLIPGWDTHEKNFALLRNQLPAIDQAWTALVTDLRLRGLENDVVVLMGGEMGRTPKITKKNAGRDHWPDTGVALFAGGGLKVGQVVGESDSKGERPKTAPIRPQHLLATMYQVLGIDPATTIPDHRGRPQYLLDDRQVVPGLF